MKLFFESSEQACFFAMMVSLGFVTGFCVQEGKGEGWFRFLTDLLLLLACGIAVTSLLLSGKDESLRIYHLLGLLTGVILYVSGVSRLIRWVRAKIHRFGRKQQANEE